MKVLVVGAGNVGKHLASVLSRSGHEVTLIDRDPTVLASIGEDLGVARVHGDGCEPSVLEAAGVRGTDVVIAATGDDEDNLVAANLAKFAFGVPQVVGRVKNAENAWLYEPELGVDVAVSAPHIIAQLVEERVTLGDVISLLKLERGNITLVEATIPPESPVAGKAIREVAWPAECALVAIIRDAHVVPATGDTVIESGNQLLAVVDVAQVEALHQRLGVVPPRRR